MEKIMVDYVNTLSKFGTKLADRNQRTKFNHLKTRYRVTFEGFAAPIGGENITMDMRSFTTPKGAFEEQVIEPAVVPFAKYQSYGMGVVYMRPITDKSFFVINYTPHFFRRYHERYIIPQNYNITDTGKRIEHFFVNNSIPSYDFSPAKNNFIGYYNQGIIFGEHTDDRTALKAKTFVSRTMLYNDQASTDDEISFIRQEVANSPDYLRDRNQFWGAERYGKQSLHREF